VDVDLEPCCDRVSPDVRLTRVARQVREKRLLRLIGRSRRAGGLVGDLIQATEMGTAPGSPLAPVLANVLWDDRDTALEHRGPRCTR
jgi:retron-type reverse transcriptase